MNDKTSAELLAEFPVRVSEPVLWNDMDAYGHINNIIYFRYFESARMAYFERIGFGYEPGTAGPGPILAATDCRYKVSLTHPDTIDIGARISAIEHDSFTMHYAVFSRHHGRIAAQGTAKIVVLNYALRTRTPLPDAIRERIEALEKR